MMLLVGTFLLLLSSLSAAQESSSLFDCPEGTFCTQYTDGCNQCNSAEGSPTAVCTDMYCFCYDDNSCIPECFDNALCVPKKQQNGTTTTNTTDSGIIDSHCDPEADGTDQSSCLWAPCDAPPQGCSYITRNYMWDGRGNCCPEQCVLVNDADGRSCDFGAPNQCDPATSGTDPNSCPVADCVPTLPEGCSFVKGDFFWDMNGNCCQEQCKTEDANGGPCDFGGDESQQQPLSDGPTGDCIPNGDEACAVARCMAPPEGCNYKFDHYVMSEMGVCCPDLCYAVDANGVECRFEAENSNDGRGETSNSTNTTTVEIGDTCTPNQTTATARQGVHSPDCPVAKCAEAPTGCEYVFDHYVIINEAGDCCPSLCYAVDGEGAECSFMNELLPVSGAKSKFFMPVSLMGLVLLSWTL